MRIHLYGQRHAAVIAFCAAIVLLGAGGCARAPAGGTAGVRLIVTLRFDHGVNDFYQYFVLIRNANDSGPQNGPVPVIAPPYQNGFATGEFNGTGTTAGFTDFVEYSRAQRATTPSGYALYHLPGGINGDPNRNVFDFRGEPVATAPPNGGTQLQFELNLGQLQPASGEPDPNNGQQPRYLQINVVATTTTPAFQQTPDPNKFLDAFGDQSVNQFTSYLQVDAAQVGKTYHSSNSPGDPYYEPDNDEYPPGGGDPSVELTFWSIQVVGG